MFADQERERRERERKRKRDRVLKNKFKIKGLRMGCHAVQAKRHMDADPNGIF